MHISDTFSSFIKEMTDIQANIIITGDSEKSIQHAFQYLFSLYDPTYRIIGIDMPKFAITPPHYLSFTTNDEYNASYYVQNAVRMNANGIVLHELDRTHVHPFLVACNAGGEGVCSSHFSSHPTDTLSFLEHALEKEANIPQKERQTVIKEGIDIFLHCKEIDNEVVFEQVYCFDNPSYALQPLWNKEINSIREENISTNIQEKRQRLIERNTPVVKIEKPKRNILSKDYQKNAIDFLSAYGKKYDIENLEKQLFPVLEPSISIQRTLREDDGIPIGSSKFGGDPDLPSSIPYPYYEDIPYLFVCQINCEEVAAHDVSNKLPKTGMLYFFHLFEDEMIILEHEDDDFPKYKKSALVLHHEGDISELVRTKIPETEHFEPVRSANISFVTRYTTPDPYERKAVYNFLNFLQEGVWDEDDDVLWNIHSALPRLAFETPDDLLSDEDAWHHFYDKPFHQFYGEPNFCQSYPLDEMESWIFPKANVEKKDYTLLLQFEVDEEINLWWAADGGMYYYISAEDLANKDFSTVYSIMQCG